MAQLTEQIPAWPSQIMATVADIAATHGWKVVRKNFNEAEIRTNNSALAWGKKITVRVDGNRLSPATSTVTVSSTARFRVYDRGKTRDDITLVMESIKQKLRTVAVQPMAAVRQASNPRLRPRTGTTEDIKFCAMCGKKLKASAVFCSACGARQD